MKALGVCGSPRIRGNTETILSIVLKELEILGVGVEMVNVCRMDVKPCTSCRTCVKTGKCSIDDDMARVIVPKLLSTDILVLATPVYFNNVSACMKAFIDRTWSLRGRLRNKVGGGMVVGRGYGLELALVAIHSFMLKHEMIICHRGVSCRAYNIGEALADKRAVEDARKLAKRLYEVALIIETNNRKS